jgi:hypothetical protein
MQRKVYTLGKPAARESGAMNFISALHPSHLRAGGSFCLSVSMIEHYARFTGMKL